MARIAVEIFEFGDFVLDPAERLLLFRGQPVRLTPKTFDLLVALVRHRGRLMSKDRLLDEVWPQIFVAEINLSVNISALRKCLGLDRGRQAFIETVPKGGYRFVAPVRVASRAAMSSSRSPAGRRRPGSPTRSTRRRRCRR